MSEQFSAISFGPSLPAAYIGAIDEVLATRGATLHHETMQHRDEYHVRVLDLTYDGGAPDLRRAVEQLSWPGPADGEVVDGLFTAVVPSALRRARRKLLIMDVDSTLIQQEVIELLADHAGVGAEVAAVTESAMRGELDFTESLYARVATLEGLPVSVIDDVRRAVRLSPGAETLIHSFSTAGHPVAVVSGGFSQILEPLADDLRIDYRQANLLEVDGGRLTGKVLGPVTDRAAKAAALRRWAHEASVPLDATVAVGDGANDVDMLATSGFGIAYNAKQSLRLAADAQINIPQLDAAVALAGVEYA
ncbi:phosphoserine phosphatase SerB [Arthrobacter castelli]|uniref:phosphoserine phosphatase SerB n=1 Tax=Arthrobacter castelli TaxID=271431 RepID=UPI00042A01FB|nr:phosphoserine phosphatase SerB [Arthrobacter castelli]